MALGKITTGSHYPKLLGTYEQELHPTIARLAQRGHDTIVDVGCGEGFYAVGLAVMLRSATVYAFDIDESARSACREAAAANGAGRRVVVGAACSHGELDGLCAPPRRTVVVCDCEGCELPLIDPVHAPNLGYADLLVETHEFAARGITGTLVSRFTATHEIEMISVSPRSPDTVDLPSVLSTADKVRVLDESRPTDQTWLLLLSRHLSDVTSFTT